MMILGIESTAHTFGIGIVKDGKILSNVKKMYMTEKGGIIPTESAKFHEKNKADIYSEALEKAGIKEEDVDAIAFSQGPGLFPCLMVGLRFAKELANKLKKPVVPVNHCISHLEVGKITGAKDPVMLYCSGANTQIIAYASGKYRIFGETLDIGVGNFIDTFARYAEIGFPGGPVIQKLAEENKEKNYIELPYKVKGMDVAFSGILTNLKQKLESKKYSLADLSYSLQETVFAMLVETAERAIAHTGKKELLLGGGVACNKRLQEMCKIMCAERTSPLTGSSNSQAKEREEKIKLFILENSLLTDNGAMIAYLGEIMFKRGIKVSYKEADKLDIMPRQRTDDVEVNWK
jgi:N6-L-threonylcarbamoyladenine synthase